LSVTVPTAFGRAWRHRLALTCHQQYRGEPAAPATPSHSSDPATYSVVDPDPSPDQAPDRTPNRTPAATIRRRRWMAALAGVVVVVVLVVIVLAVGGGGSDSGGLGPASQNGVASVIPGDALTLINVSIDGSAPSVKQALAVGRRFPDFPIAGAAAISRVAAILGGGHAVDFSRQISPWLGDDAALALLNTTTSTAGSLVVVSVSDFKRAQSFVHSIGAVSHGTYRDRTLLAYPDGSELTFIRNYLVIGQDASLRAAIDAASGATASLAADPAFKRAAAGEPGSRVIDAYASPAGVRRVLAGQGGILGALGDLLDQPALQGVAMWLTPTAQGARIQIHSVLDPSLAHLNSSAAAAFAPSLQAVMPAGSSLMLDVTGLDKVAPGVLNAGSAAGVAGGIGPLLSRLGTALGSEGVNVKDLVSIFHSESAVAIVGSGQRPTLVIVARTSKQAKTQTELAQLEAPLAQLFSTPSKSSSSVPVFNDKQVAGVTAHQLQLATGLQLDYAVFRGLVVISTSLQGIADVAQRSHPLAKDPGFGATLSDRPKLVTAMVFADLATLLNVGQSTGLTPSSVFGKLEPDLQRITAVGLTSTRGADDSTTQISVRVK
jgi:hypothetical protein